MKKNPASSQTSLKCMNNQALLDMHIQYMQSPLRFNSESEPWINTALIPHHRYAIECSSSCMAKVLVPLMAPAAGPNTDGQNGSLK